MGFTVPNDSEAPAPYGGPNSPLSTVDGRDLAVLAAGQADGVVSGCAVTAQGAPDMTVAVAAGQAAVGGALVTVGGAPTLAVGANSSGSPRKDLVVVSSAGVASVVAGAPAATPVFPAVPAASTVLAMVYVPSGLAAVSSANIVDKRLMVSALQPHGMRSGHYDAFRRTGALAETVSRIGVAGNLGLTSGNLLMVAIELRAGMTVSSITFRSGTTAASNPTNQWFSLWDAARNRLGVTSNDLVAAWAAASEKTLALAASYAVSRTDLYYLGVVVTATTAMPSLAALSGTSLTTAAPILCGNSNGGQTTPVLAPATANALSTSVVAVPYAYVS